MTCYHTPSSPIAAFCFTCKHCGCEIDSVPCEKCDGMGTLLEDSNWFNCSSCLGTGVDHWEEVK
jgi:hypothetical protein